MRPDDPRLQKTVIWGEDGKPTNFEIKKIL